MLESIEFTRIDNEFRTHIKSKNYRGYDSTYTTPVTEFLAYMESIGVVKIRKVKSYHLVQYYDHLTSRPNKRTGTLLSSRTINGHLMSIGKLFDYLLTSGQIKSAPVLPSYLKGDRQERESLSMDETLEIYRNTETKLERAVLSISYGCGLRRMEIEHLDSRDVKLNKGVVIVRDGKGGVRREVPMSDGVIRDLRAYYMEERAQYLKHHNYFEKAFFVNNKGKRMAGEHMNRIIKTIIDRTGNPTIINKNITLHCLRHSLAEHLVENGAEVEYVKKILGHKEIDTSYLYCIKRRKQAKQLKTLSVA